MPPKGLNTKNGLPKGPNGGYLDRFDNEWVEGPAHGQAAVDADFREWDVQLSQAGINVWGKLGKTVRGTTYINVTRKGWLSH